MNTKHLTIIAVIVLIVLVGVILIASNVPKGNPQGGDINTTSNTTGNYTIYPPVNTTGNNTGNQTWYPPVNITQNNTGNITNGTGGGHGGGGTGDTNNTNTTNNATKLMLKDAFKLDSVQRYTYRMSDSLSMRPGAETINYTLLITDGIDYLVQYVSSYTPNIITTMTLDRNTLECKGVYYTDSNRDPANPVIQGNCPTDGPFAPSLLARPGLSYLSFDGNESINVPYGSFNAGKYDMLGVTYWLNEKSPIPLKVEYGSKTMELMSWS